MTEKASIDTSSDAKEEDGGTVLYVSNLTRNVTNEHLAEIFGIYGPVASAEIEKDSRVGLSKGSAYVTFKKSHDMNQAMLHLDGAQVDGNFIKATFVLVSNKRRREPSPARPVAKRRSASPARGVRPNERSGGPRDSDRDTGNFANRNFDEGRRGMREEGTREQEGNISRDMRDKDNRDRAIDDRNRGGFGVRPGGMYGPSGGGNGNRPARSPPRGGGGGMRDNRYGPSGGNSAYRNNSYGPGPMDQGQSRQQGAGNDRGGARRRSPSPVRRRSRSPQRGGARGAAPVRGAYQPVRRDAVRVSRDDEDRGRERRPRSRSRERKRSRSSSRSSSGSSRSSSSRSSRSSSSSRSRGDKKGAPTRRSSSASSSSRSRSREPSGRGRSKEIEGKDQGGEGKSDKSA